MNLLRVAAAAAAVDVRRRQHERADEHGLIRVEVEPAERSAEWDTWFARVREDVGI